MKNYYTKSEDNIIRKHIDASPNNITAALHAAASETGRTFASVNFRWYSSLRKKTKVFSLESSKSGESNVKNVPRKLEKSFTVKSIVVNNGVFTLGNITVTGTFVINF